MKLKTSNNTMPRVIYLVSIPVKFWDVSFGVDP